jgi:hypothetical protein
MSIFSRYIKGLLQRIAGYTGLEIGSRRSPDETRYYMIPEDKRILLEFDRPDEKALRRLRNCLETATIVPPGRRPPHELAASASCVAGTLDNVMSRLKGRLEADSRENEAERADWSGDFGYWVLEREAEPGDILIMTRLWCPAKPGTISYGRVVRRVGQEDYVLWVEE